MSLFINPLEILGLKDHLTTGMDFETIKKAKRKLIAEIELSDDGFFDYEGSKLTKSDCERAIDELENKTHLDFYAHLSENKELSGFLKTGDVKFLTSLKQESIYQLPEFIDFISPYIASKLNSSLLEAFRNGSSKDLELLLSKSYLVSSKYLNNAYSFLSKELDSRIQSIDVLTDNIRNEISALTEDTLEETVKDIKEKFPIDVMNALPTYFQSQVNKVAASVNYLQLAIWNTFNETSVPVQLLDHLLSFEIDSVSKPTFVKNREIINQKHLERLEQKKHSPTIKKWADILLSIQSKIKQVEDNQLSANAALKFVQESFSISELNSLDSFADEIRSQIGLSIRSMSIASWNKQEDIHSALALIRLATTINVPSDIMTRFRQDNNELEELEKNYRGVLVCYFCDKNKPTEGSGIVKTIYKETNRTYFPQRRVQFQSSVVTIPRCTVCQQVHQESESKNGIIFWITAGVCFVLGLISGHWIIGTIAAIIVGIIVAAINDSSVEATKRKEKGVKSTSNLENHPLLKERFKDGWSFSQPTA
jgi:hypothetical protein